MAEKSARRIAAEQAAQAASKQRLGDGPSQAQIDAHDTAMGNYRHQIGQLEGQLRGPIDRQKYTSKERYLHRGPEMDNYRYRDVFDEAGYNKAAAEVAGHNSGINARLSALRSTMKNAEGAFDRDPDNKMISTRLQNQGFGKSKREKDIMSGAKFGEALIGRDGLGRLSEDVDVQETLGRYKDVMEQGLSSQEVEAERTAAFRGIDRANQGAMRGIQARLAAMGVKGATAGQQLLQGALAGAGKKADVERDLFLKSADVKREGLRDYSSRLGQMKTFDLAQAAREKDIVLQAAMGQGQMGVAERSAALQAQASENAARAKASAAPSCFTGDTQIRMSDNTTKSISELDLGDMTETGEVLGLSKHLRKGQPVYLYDGTFVTGKHIVRHEGEWMHVEDTGALKAICNDKFVYNIWTSSNTVRIGNTLFADYEGFHSLDINNKILEEMNEFEANEKLLQGEVR